MLEKWDTQLIERERRRKLNLLCKTRWVEGYEAFELSLELFEKLVCWMEESKDSKELTVNQEQILNRYSALYLFPFHRSPYDILGYTKGLSIKLLGRYLEIVKAYKAPDYSIKKSRVREMK